MRAPDYVLAGLDRPRRLTAGRAWWVIVLVVVVVVAAVCTGQAVTFCENCQSNALEACEKEGPDAFVCNYNCSTSACGLGSNNCQYNCCKPKTEADTTEPPAGGGGGGG